VTAAPQQVVSARQVAPVRGNGTNARDSTPDDLTLTVGSEGSGDGILELGELSEHGELASLLEHGGLALLLVRLLLLGSVGEELADLRQGHGSRADKATAYRQGTGEQHTRLGSPIPLLLPFCAHGKPLAQCRTRAFPS
jgi:hypothetical protein